MRRRTHNYSSESGSLENLNYDDKYVISGESQWSRGLTVPYDENDVLIERHLTIGDDVLGQDYRGLGPKGYRRRDTTIYEDVCETLWRSPQVDPSEIEVSVDHGVVKLQGIVHKRDFKRWAERLIEDLPGVVDVMNEIKVMRELGGLIQNRTGLA